MPSYQLPKEYEIDEELGWLRSIEESTQNVLFTSKHFLATKTVCENLAPITDASVKFYSILQYRHYLQRLHTKTSLNSVYFILDDSMLSRTQELKEELSKQRFPLPLADKKGQLCYYKSGLKGLFSNYKSLFNKQVDNQLYSLIEMIKYCQQENIFLHILCLSNRSEIQKILLQEQVSWSLIKNMTADILDSSSATNIEKITKQIAEDAATFIQKEIKIPNFKLRSDCEFNEQEPLQTYTVF